MFASDSPTIPPKTRPRSKRSNGNRHNPATAFAVKLFPQPGTPSNSAPRGGSSPNALACEVNARPRFLSQCFNSSKPPTSSHSVRGWKYSKTPLCRIIRSFSSITKSISAEVRRPLVATALLNARRASIIVNPSAASRSASLFSTWWGNSPASSTTSSKMMPSVWRRGRSNSMIGISLSSSRIVVGVTVPKIMHLFSDFVIRASSRNHQMMKPRSVLL